MDLDIVGRFETYEDYLDSKITQEHLYYLGSKDVARQLFELGCVGGLDIMERSKFQQKKQELQEQKTTKRSAQVPLAHINCDSSKSPLMMKLAEIEDEVRNGQKTCLIFLRSINAKEQEISAYIDYADRLRTEDWVPYFSCKKLLKPKITDMSFFNWKTRTITHNESSTFDVKANNDRGIIVTNKRDQKDINLDPTEKNPGDNTKRYDIDDPNYLHCVLYIHDSRRKA